MNYKRDISNLSRKDLLEDYGLRSKSGDDTVVKYALRNSSVSVRDILVRTATNLDISAEALKKLVLSDRFMHDFIIDANELGNLGRLALLQDTLENDIAFGVELLETAVNVASSDDLSLKNRLVLTQHYILNGSLEEARKLMHLYPDLKSISFGYLQAELDNPFTCGSNDTKQRWLEAFNRVFTEHALAPVELNDNGDVPFDRLKSLVGTFDSNVVDDGPLVSVVLTAFQPDKTRLVTSVKSIVNQTWKNLEIIIVDDHSGEEFKEIFDEVGMMDERIQIIEASQNRGTYVARNIGYAASNGIFITGQDDDDWSHPERIAYQVHTMQENRKAIGCRVRAVRCKDSLNRVYLNVLPVGQNASSLFIRREAYEASGGYLEVRKAGDTEFHKRIEAITGQQVVEIRKPLSIIRMLPASLSHGDFGPGWMHDSRHSFRSSYTYWHKTSKPEQLDLSNVSEPPINIPRRLALNKTKKSPRDFDVVFAGDWQSFGGPQKSMIEEITALREQNFRIGILDLEPARFMYRRQRLPLTKHIQSLINVGAVDEVHYDEDVRTRLLVLRYPPILEFFKHETSALSARRMLIVANQAPAELDGSDVRYLVDDVDAQARESFGVTPTWVPQGPQIREVLNYYLDTPKLAGYDMPGILDPAEWWLDRLWYRSFIPVVGRHSRDNKMKWPADKSELDEIYRTDGHHDVRIMGGAKTPLAVRGESTIPSAWTVYKKDEMSVASFLYSLDYFVYFQHPAAIEAFGRAILEAIAAGVFVILPNHFEEVFGDAAIYAAPDEVRGVINKYHADFSLYQNQLRRSREVLETSFSYEAYQYRINQILVEYPIEASL